MSIDYYEKKLIFLRLKLAIKFRGYVTKKSS